MVAAATMLESPNGLKERQVLGQSQEELWRTYDGRDLSLDLEVAYACGFLNCWANETFDAIETIKQLAFLPHAGQGDSESAVLKAAEKWGASRFISYKVAFLKLRSLRLGALTDDLRSINHVLGHDQHPNLQFSAVENLFPNFGITRVAKRHTNVLRPEAIGNFRRFHSLYCLVPTPLSESDGAALLRSSVECCLIDAVHSIWVLLNLTDRLKGLQDALERNLDKGLLAALMDARSEIASLPTPDLVNLTEIPDLNYEDESLQIYRASAVFLEYPALCEYRNDLDLVFGHRLVFSLMPKHQDFFAKSFSNIEILRQPNATFHLDDHCSATHAMDNFYRTYLFLRFIQEPSQLALMDEDDLKYIFENTADLDYFLLERELETMHLNASADTKALVSVLALALFRGRSSDPDVDFEYRRSLRLYLESQYSGNVLEFISALLETNPSIAHYLAITLNENTVQKIYGLVKSPSEARMLCRDILLMIGHSLDCIDYIIAAEAIDTRNKVSKLKKYFDTSRMFVDSVAMQDWLATNPSAYHSEFKNLLPKLTATLTAVGEIPDTETGKVKNVAIIGFTDTGERLLRSIAKEAFLEFCTNTEFGIESYLGRRIRHNTLRGVMTDPIHRIASDPDHQTITADTDFGEALGNWMNQYERFIERMRNELLQFKSPGKPNGLFDPVLDPEEETTKLALMNLSQSLRVAGESLLHDQVIGFCWEQIAPQLTSAARKIRVSMAEEVKSMLYQSTSSFMGPEERRLQQELNEAIDSIFSKVSSWFRRPETGYTSATMTALCNIIDIEFDRLDTPTIVTSEQPGTEYYGLSVHKLYDCLAVLLQNAFRDADPFDPVRVTSHAEQIENTNLQRVFVSVFSKAREGQLAYCLTRINAALDAPETSNDMATEGYSGLKKLKYITRLNEGSHTLGCRNVEDSIELFFTLKVEVAEEQEDGHEDLAG